MTACPVEPHTGPDRGRTGRCPRLPGTLGSTEILRIYCAIRVVTAGAIAYGSLQSIGPSYRNGASPDVRVHCRAAWGSLRAWL